MIGRAGRAGMESRWLFAAVVAGSLAFAVAPDARAQGGQGSTKGGTKADSGASADKPLDKKQLADAKKHYGDGDAKFKMGAYAEALTDFQAADAVKATPQAARFIGLCFDKLNKFPEAVTAYERFLANVPPKMHDSGEDAKIQSRVAEIKALPGKLHVTSDPKGARVAVDTTPQPNPTPTDIDVAPGHHVIHFTALDHEAVDKQVDVAFASKQDVAATLPASAPAPVAVVAPIPAPAPAAPPPPVDTPPDTPPEPVHHSSVPAYVTGGLAIAAAGVGTVFGIMALSDKSDFDSHPTSSTADSGENHALICDMAFGVALTLGVTSLVLFLSHDDAPATPSASPSASADPPRPKTAAFTITPSPIVTQHGAGAGALVRF